MAMPERMPSTTRTTRTSISVKPFLIARIRRREDVGWQPLRQSSEVQAVRTSLDLLLGPIRRRFGLEERCVLTIALGLELRGRNEAHRRGVHAVAQAGGARSVIEEVTQVRIGVRRSNLSALIAKHAVGLRADVRWVERPREAWPAGAGVVFVERAEERLAGNDIHVDPRLVVVPIDIAERSLRLRVLRYRVLERGQLFLQIGVGRFYEGAARSRRRSSGHRFGLGLRGGAKEGRCGTHGDERRKGGSGLARYSIECMLGLRSLKEGSGPS